MRQKTNGATDDSLTTLPNIAFGYHIVAGQHPELAKDDVSIYRGDESGGSGLFQRMTVASTERQESHPNRKLY